MPLPVETVARVLNRRPVAFVPRGELFINKNFLDFFFSRRQGHYIEQLKGAAEFLELSVLGIELVPERSSDLLKEGVFRVLEPTFLVGCLNGPVSGLINQLGFIEAMLSTKKRPDVLTEISRRVLAELDRVVPLANKNNFQAIAITDDLAGNQGLFFSLAYFQETLLPVYKAMIEIIKRNGMFAFFHSDGDIRQMIESLIQAGIDCLHPVDALAGQDLYQLVQEFGHRVSFMGHIDPLSWNRERVHEEIDRAETEFKNGGLILGSTCGLSMETFNENFMVLYPQWKHQRP